ncbi:kynureninase [Sphingosinicella rhizophila]|uniref:Kynureninase n=1 Tax=Sphingosinicella rhizophila TaxID=3050082 RepID=A0ABU3Q7E5_9SPHN|nr:kynureninase [Sphingosinicella sp. GR2756]MDT9598870.1 kynureninase [Sphingosinicella sp. GR2756]
MMTKITFDHCLELDAADPLAEYRSAFLLPEGLIYLDGNSLGALPAATPGVVADVVQRQWGADLIRSWTSNDWINAPLRVGAKIAGLIGAGPDEVIVGDSTSANLYKLIVAALEARPDRTIVLSEEGNFPTDLYMIHGAIATVGRGCRLETRPRETLADAITQEVALVLLTQTHYKTADKLDMAAMTARAHEAGALILWDLSHSAGAVEVDLNGAGADLAVGCGYKYLNGGPGAPAFLFVAKRHHGRLRSPLSGWMGHSSPFDFVDDYRPAEGIRRFLCGTPPILGIAALEVGVDLIARAGMARLAEKSRHLCSLMIDLVEQECDFAGLQLVTPREASRRGSHVSFRHPEGYAIVQALIEEGVIGDFRAPDILRFGFTPLYVGFADVWEAVQRLKTIMADRRWDRDDYRVRAAVT